MPVTVSDPRTRTRNILLDLSNPNSYRITIVRESVQEMSDTGAVARRATTRIVKRDIVFDANGVPSGDPLVLALLPGIKSAIEALEVADIAAEAAAAAAVTG